MTTVFGPEPWTGRIDGPGPEYRRWHAAVGSAPAGAVGLALVGFRSDEGVRRNGGRPGAALGPTAIRRALAPLSIDPGTVLRDIGDIGVDSGDLEGAQDVLGDTVAGAITDGDLPVVLGGGHETAYGDYLGLRRGGALDGRTLGVLNLDAHFDLRRADRATSGTPFRQIATDEARRGSPLRYAVLGISEANNTRALFDASAELGAGFRLDEDCQERHTEGVLGFVRAFLDRVDVLHLSLDLDVLPAAVAPGVSAPATLGVPLAVVLEVGKLVAASGKLRLFDVVELNPGLDRDNQTAAVAARVIRAVTAAHTARAGRA